MKWKKPYQLMRVKRRFSTGEQEFETVLDGDELYPIMKIAHQLLVGASKDDTVKEERLEIWFKEPSNDSIINVVGHYYLFNTNFKKEEPQNG